MLRTYLGKRIDPFAPDANLIDVLDIAHSLSLINRFAGHTPHPYSVAQHCLLVSHIVDKPGSPYGLLHDAHEYLLGDIPRPISRTLCPNYKVYASRLQDVILEVLVRRQPTKSELEAVTVADDFLLKYEIANFWPDSTTDVKETLALGEKLFGRGSVLARPMDPSEVRNQFNQRYLSLMR